ncbi:MAG: sporulation protein YqfD [Clostridia bacterium]|nr:sporulation protein YqfD [Clostridia bacterium]
MRRSLRKWPVVVRVEGLNLNRFVRTAGEAGIRLTQVRRLSLRRLKALVREEELPALTDIAVQGGWQLHAGERKGSGRVLAWLSKRWLLSAGAAAALIALAAASRVMWRIEVVDGGSYTADIQSALQELNISAPMLRCQVDIGQLREALEWRYPRIAWIECGWRGTTLVIRPVTGVLPMQEETPTGMRHVVAARDAVVKQIVTRSGTPAVKPGDIVRAGDILIKGEERTSDGAVRPVAARGRILGRVWQAAEIVMPVTETSTRYTGNRQTVWTVRTPWFDFWPMADCGYDTWDTSVSEMPLCGIFLPMTLHMETRIEAICERSRRELQDVKAEAEAAALRKLYEIAGGEESLIDIWGNCSMIDSEKVQASAIGEMLVEIGVQSSPSDMAAPEQSEDSG